MPATPVRAVDCLEEIRQAAARLEAEGVPEPSDEVIRELAAVFRLARTPPLQQPLDRDPAPVGGDLDPAALHGDAR